jgi:hypothetical protein
VIFDVDVVLIVVFDDGDYHSKQQTNVNVTGQTASVTPFHTCCTVATLGVVPFDGTVVAAVATTTTSGVEDDGTRNEARRPADVATLLLVPTVDDGGDDEAIRYTSTGTPRVVA